MTERAPVSTPKPKSRWKRWLLRAFLVLLILAVPTAVLAWYKIFREVPQPAWITGDPEQNFLHGSLGAESDAGIPYWIVVTLPRVFGDLLPGPGGYAALGIPWKEGDELPAGFSKKTVGFERVTFNCALCHATQYRTAPDTNPTIVAAGGSNTTDLQGLLDFFGNAARDARFDGETILPQIDMAHKLGWLDRILYKFVFIPITRDRLKQQSDDFVWAHSRPPWGPGRDAPMNLTKFNFLNLPRDKSVDNTDFPSLWHLRSRVQPGRVWPPEDDSLVGDWSKVPVPLSRLMMMNLDGATTSFRAVIIDSTLGVQARNTPFFRRRVADLETWLMDLPAPRYPLPLDAALVERGRPVYEAACASCHASGRDNRMGTIIPLAEIGTDPERSLTWTKPAADKANQTVRERFGIHRTPMVKPPDGYVALQLDGIWLRGPYLHNGSVPTLRALLDPEAARPAVFYRGYDVLDRWNGGFLSRRCAGVEPELPPVPVATESQWGCMPSDEGWRYDTAVRGNDRGGHLYGVGLSAEEKTALVEYLKTL